MSQLDQIRTKINDIDEKMAALFEERMHMSEQVAAFKRERGLSVRDAEREREAKAREEALLKEQEKAESHSLPRGAYAPFDVDAT